MSSDDGDSGGGGGKTFLILGILLGVGVGGGLGYMFAGQEVTDGPSKEEEVIERPMPVVLKTVDFEKLAIPVFVKRGGRSRSAGNFLLDLVVRVNGEEDQIRVGRRKFALRQAFLIAVSKGDIMIEGSTTRIDYDKASKILTKAAGSIVGPENIVDVIIKQAVKTR